MWGGCECVTCYGFCGLRRESEQGVTCYSFWGYEVGRRMCHMLRFLVCGWNVEYVSHVMVCVICKDCWKGVTCYGFCGLEGCVCFIHLRFDNFYMFDGG